ncbi:MAG: aldehyde dehydrogenase family protein [Solirubrobacterales bacterium]|nr:aldehyde dehydrogenase family protein [Solirubrobacterales bacterium]
MTALATIEVRSPFDGELVGSVPAAGPEQVRAMLDRAGDGLWSASRHERSELLSGVASRLLESASELAELISRESGLCLKDTRHEVARAVDVFRFAAIETLRDDGEAFAGDVTAHGRDRRAYTLREPVRLVGAITPFNHPLNQVAHKLAPAIAVGAPIVLKPSERTPLTAVRLAELLAEVGVPAQAAQVVCGEPAMILDEFLGCEAVEVVSFTGSVAVGRAIAARLGFRRAVLELGGNDPLLVLADADLDEAAELAVRGAFANSGQRCTAVKRIIAVDSIAGELAERIVDRTRSLRVGDPLDEATDVGTVIDAAAARLIEGRVVDAVRDGARLLYGGERFGAQLVPAVLDHVPREAGLVAAETFGPVAPIIRVRDLDEAIEVANATRYALSSAVCSFDWRAIQRCIRELRAGTVNVREVPGWRTELTPFGGIGDSGLGVKEGVREAIRAMSFTKLYTLPWG